MKRKLLWAVAVGAAMCLVVLGVVKQRRAAHVERSGQAHVQGDTRDLGNTIVTPHLDQKIVPGKNVIWCNTFQLAWNGLCDFTGGPVKMRWGPPMVDILNRRTASKSDLDKASYVAMGGLMEDGIEEKIRQALDRKFHGQADPELPYYVPVERWVMYAYLFKDLPFRWAFERFEGMFAFEGQMVDSFGSGDLLAHNGKGIASLVLVHDYVDQDDLVIELKTKAEDDQLILAKVVPEKSLAATVATVRRRVKQDSPAPSEDLTSLYVPVLDFKVLRDYYELCGRETRTTNGKLDGKPIGVALQSIRFRLDERGAVLKSEAMEGAMGGIAEHLFFDKPFLILLKRRKAENPYFAMWVGNADLMISRGKAKPPEDQ